MTLEEIKARASDHSLLASLVGDRWYEGPLPKGSRLPAVTLEHLPGGVDRFTVWGRCYQTVDRVAFCIQKTFHVQTHHGRIRGTLHQATMDVSL